MNLSVLSKKVLGYCWWQVKLRKAGVSIDLRSVVLASLDSVIELPRGTKIRSARIHVGHKAKFRLGKQSVVCGCISIGDDCAFLAGDDFRILDGSLVIRSMGRVELKDSCLIERVSSYRGELTVLGGILIAGSNVSLRGVISVNTGAKVSIGDNTFLNHGSEVRCAESINIGHNVFISYFVDLFDNNSHSTNYLDRRKEVASAGKNSTITDYTKVIKGAVNIGDDVWVGKRATILKGCTIGDRSIVGTRSVVTSSCPADTTLVGNPARAI